MRGLPSTGLKTRSLVAKSVQSCLPEGLPYNWDQKLRELVVGICLSRSLLLQSIAQTRVGHVRTNENNLSAFLSRKRLEMSPAQRACIVSALKRMSRRRVWKQGGKAAMIIDGTSYAKTRSRGKKKAMPGKGKVRVHNLPIDETILVPGYQEIWCCLLLNDGTVLPITRRLWSENGPDCASMNLAEEAEIRRAADIVRETFKLDVILVADSGYRRKELLDWLKRVEGLDFVIRIEGNLKIFIPAVVGTLRRVGEHFSSLDPVAVAGFRVVHKRIVVSRNKIVAGFRRSNALPETEREDAVSVDMADRRFDDKTFLQKEVDKRRQGPAGESRSRGQLRNYRLPRRRASC
ncbi:MAG: transposase [Elusimicrobia bacterium]|nr:transposase [Elusimicrobiota bacterium]